MKAHACPSSAIALGPFLTSIPLSREVNIDQESLPKSSDDVTTRSGAVMRSVAGLAEPRPTQAVMVRLGRMISMIRTPRRRRAWWRGLTLLTMLCQHSPRHDRIRLQGPTLPPGCVMVARYTSR